MPNNPAPEFNVEIASQYDFEQTLDRVRRSIQSEGLLLLHEINTQQIVKSRGIEINGLLQLLFFHPRYIKAILELNYSGVVEAPLKLVVMETDSQVVVVRYIQPSYLFGRYAGLEVLGNDLNHIVSKVTATVTH